MGQGAWYGKTLHAAVDARRFEDADDDREGPIPLDFLEENDLLLVILVDDDPRKFHLHGHGHRHPLVPASLGLTRNPRRATPRIHPRWCLISLDDRGIGAVRQRTPANPLTPPRAGPGSPH